MGMTYEQFWRDDAKIAKYYLKDYKIKMNFEKEKEEIKLWKQGVYDYEALVRVSPIMHAFAQKGTKPLPFPDKPIFKEVVNKESEKKEPTKQEIENERLKAQIFFNNWYRSAKKHFEGK